MLCFGVSPGPFGLPQWATEAMQNTAEDRPITAPTNYPSYFCVNAP